MIQISTAETLREYLESLKEIMEELTKKRTVHNGPFFLTTAAGPN